jgi:ATP-dependent helicase/DNAse subunit B
MLSELKKKFSSGISPTALTTYIRNPLDFYQRYVLGLRELEEIEEDISFRTFGTVIHDCLELLYQPYLGKILKEEDIDHMLKSYPSHMSSLFQEKFQEESLRHGKNLIDFEVAKHQVKRFLLQEKNELKHKSLQILELEKDREKHLKIDGIDFKVKLYGKVDRIDVQDGCRRIIDYKTGKVEQKDLNIPENWEGFTEEYSFSKAFQVLFYALLNEDTLGEEDTAGIISFKSLKTGYLHCKAPKSDKNLKALVEEYKIELEHLILEILNPEIPFTEKQV